MRCRLQFIKQLTNAYPISCISLLLLCLCLWFSQAQAACTVVSHTETYPLPGLTDFSAVPMGGLIYKVEFILNTSTPYAECDTQGGSIRYSTDLRHFGTSSSGTATYYPTDNEGEVVIGVVATIRNWLDELTINEPRGPQYGTHQFGGNQKITIEFRKDRENLYGYNDPHGAKTFSKIPSIEVFKIWGDRGLRTYRTGAATLIASQCQLAAVPPVILPSATTEEINSNAAKIKHFTVRFQKKCPTGFVKINIKNSGSPNAQQGILPNNAKSNAARGVGVQLLNEQSNAVQLNTAMPANYSSTDPLAMVYQARLYKSGRANVKAGAVEAQVDVEVTYN